jgi:ChpA-C
MIRRIVAVVAIAGGLAIGATQAALAESISVSAPGVVAGNVVQVPVEVPVNVCGNTVNVVGLLNPIHGNVCINK